MENFDLKKYLSEGILLKEGNHVTELEKDIKDFVRSIEDDNYQRSKDNDPDYEEVKPSVKFFKQTYPEYDKVPDEMIEPFLNEGEGNLNEVQLDPENQKLKDHYIDAYLSMTMDPYYYDENEPDISDIENHAKEYGYENTLRTIDKMEDVERARNQNFGNEDPLARKSPGNSIDNLYMRDPMQNLTKSGKMNKLDVDRLKMRIKKNLGI
jgi:hypothetical protein